MRMLRPWILCPLAHGAGDRDFSTRDHQPGSLLSAAKAGVPFTESQGVSRGRGAISCEGTAGSGMLASGGVAVAGLSALLASLSARFCPNSSHILSALVF